MRYFLIILLGLIPFLSPAQVCIKPSTARWYLEQADMVVILTKKDSLNQQQINLLDRTINLQKEVILTYQGDSTTYNQQIATKDEELALKDLQIKHSKKEIRKHKVHKVMLIISLGLLITLEFAN